MNKEVLDIFNQNKATQQFDHIRIGIASPEKYYLGRMVK